MTVTIAVAGKGGTGKTTITTLIIRHIIENNLGDVLAIDADPSTNLNLALGVELEETVGDIREEALVQAQSGGMGGISKHDYLDLRMNQALVEAPGFDLLAMGRPEGPGCYCAANNILRLCVDRLAKNYDYVVIDNEAGLEHLSRRTTRDVDLLLLISDPTLRGLLAAARAANLIKELKTHASEVKLVINRVITTDGQTPDLFPQLQRVIDENGLELAALIPMDPTVAEFDAIGRPLIELPADAPVSKAVEELIERTATLRQRASP